MPLELASRLEALCEMHPEQTRSQLLVDLVGLGLVEVERARSGSSASAAGFAADARQPIYLLTGPFAEFHGLSRKHYLAMEQALAKDEPPVASPMDAYVLGDVE